ncbi:HTH domain-containing protein [Halegenticoccus tardaugens]|uniref:HTH domain-containing protein n=1 Tax=Halegenticoccus tardaugens TaxID=2071624 RepID=UPI001E62C531|nr:HTH domain-containing protein [Halegenticoccus tardaugens]
MSERVRNDAGEFVETVTPERILQVLRTVDDPVATAGDIAEILDCTPEAVRQKLTVLHDQGRVARRKVGARAVVWWLTEEEPLLNDGGEHNRDDPFFAESGLEGDHGEPIPVADTDEILGDALSEFDE